jgi:hypothetical protein
MKLLCVGGPRAGVFFVLSNGAASCNNYRLPNGLWFDDRDADGRNVQHHYTLQWGQTVLDNEVVIQYAYQGAVEACGDYLPAPEPNTTK